MSDLRPVRRALLSVWDKRGLVDFGRFLSRQGVELVSTGGSARALREAGLAVTDVSAITDFPEIMDGRVKTLHPRIHGGLLARADHAGDEAALSEHGIPAIDLLAVNLYPFETAVARGADDAECIETIDIGGPAMVRAAAKTHDRVSVVTSPDDYELVCASMEANGGAVPGDLRRRLAADAFAHTAAYDAAVAEWTAQRAGLTWPREIAFAGRRQQTLRYGENPHQQAAFYASVGRDGARPGVATARQLQGKALSYNNLNDTDAAYELAAEFGEPACVIVKHANPCGVAVADDAVTAYHDAFACDPMSAYGGIVAVNTPVDEALARAVTGAFAEVVIAPEITEAAAAVFAGKTNLRVLAAGALPDPATPALTARTLSGGLLIQTRDHAAAGEADLEVVTGRRPDARELRDLLIAERVAKHVASNAIVYVRHGATVGIGAGQMSRVDAAAIAARKARAAAEQAGESGSRTEGAAVASDAFFPFADGLTACADAGATAVVQPGGGKRDQEVVAAADARGLAMALTYMRHFRH